MSGWAWPALGALGGIAAAVALWPFALEALRPRMTEARRRAAPGRFARLSRGLTHYRWLGAEEGPVAVCVHGLSTPSFVWEPLAEHLGRRGWRVLVYDLYGRGFSDRVKGVQDSAFFNTQLDELLAHEGVKDGFALLGYSMGGAIAAAYAAARPGRVRHLVLLAPAGMGHDLGPWARLAIHHPWFGRWLVYGFYPRSLRRGIEAERDLPGYPPEIVEAQLAETRMQGLAPSVLASLRGILSEDLEPAHRALARAGLPVLAIWGERDEIIPLSGRDRLAEWNRDAVQVVLAGADHSLTYTRPGEVAAIIERHVEP